jgi:thymidylate kinase
VRALSELPAHQTRMDPALKEAPTSPVAFPAGAHEAGIDLGHPLELVRRLCDALSAERISYCHWKSNEALDRSARADSDLDLLVSRRHAQRFGEIIRGLGFKDGRQPAKKQLPGVFHSYGLDEATGKVVHIHAHYQLVLGDDMTKNYRLPIEEAYLASAEQDRLFRVPAAEFEYVVFVLRMVLKHSTLDAILTRQGALSPGETRELAYLTDRIDGELPRGLVREHLPFIDQDLWERCERCLKPRTSRVFRVWSARRLERSLAAHARRSPNLDQFVRAWRRGQVTLRRRVLHRRPSRSRLDNGGALIAIVGGDGAGKSTVVDEVHRWLSKDLDTVNVHLGKPPRSLTSVVVHAVWNGSIRGVADGSPLSGRTPTSLSDGDPMSPRRFAKLARKVMTSRDRYLAYLRARRCTADGGIVVCDRFPLPQVKLMDGPATAGIPRSRDRSRAVGFLARIEERYYERILYPDILIVLRVHPEIAVQRRHGTESEEFVRRRSEEIWHLEWGDLPVIVIDAGRPKPEVLAEIKSAIWARL